jgi:hypothetical protein
MYKAMIKKLIKIVYSEALYPIALNYVKSTSNPWDDKALEFLNGLFDDLLEQLT